MDKGAENPTTNGMQEETRNTNSAQSTRQGQGDEGATQRGLKRNFLQTPRERIQGGEPSGDDEAFQPRCKKSRSNVIQPEQIADASLPLLPEFLDEEDQRLSMPNAPLEARRAVLAGRPCLFQPIEVPPTPATLPRIPKLRPSRNPLPSFLVEDADDDTETMLLNRSSVLAGTSFPSPNSTIPCLYDW